MVPHVGTVAQFGVDDGDLLKTGTQVREKSVNFGLAKMRGNCQVLRGCHLWHMQYQSFMLNECRFDGCQRCG